MGADVSVRVTQLSEFRRMLDGGVPEAVLLSHLTEGVPESESMSLGTMFHEWVAFGKAEDGNRWKGVEWRHNLDLEDMRRGMREVTLRATVDGVDVYGTVDWWLGPILRDWKTTCSDIDVDRYTSSWQWRLYLWLSGCEVLEYWLLRCRWSEDGSAVDVDDPVIVKCFAYEGLAEECVDLVKRFKAWWRYVGSPRVLCSYVPEEE